MAGFVLLFGGALAVVVGTSLCLGTLLWSVFSRSVPRDEGTHHP
jgi:hypothetical protein